MLLLVFRAGNLLVPTLVSARAAATGSLASAPAGPHTRRALCAGRCLELYHLYLSLEDLLVEPSRVHRRICSVRNRLWAAALYPPAGKLAKAPATLRAA